MAYEYNLSSSQVGSEHAAAGVHWTDRHGRIEFFFATGILRRRLAGARSRPMTSANLKAAKAIGLEVPITLLAPGAVRGTRLDPGLQMLRPVAISHPQLGRKVLVSAIAQGVAFMI